jgi:hypothetical protein
MAEKEILALSDKTVEPDDKLVLSLIGEKRMVLWQNILDGITKNYSDISWSWNYYNDGKQWLFKLVRKKKTIFWGAIVSTGEFRISLYFGDKAAPIIESGDLPEKIKAEFRTAKKYGAIRAVTMLVNSDQDVENILKLVAIKMKV